MSGIHPPSLFLRLCGDSDALAICVAYDAIQEGEPLRELAHRSPIRYCVISDPARYASPSGLSAWIFFSTLSSSAISSVSSISCFVMP